jgi:hypothetical protein
MLSVLTRVSMAKVLLSEYSEQPARGWIVPIFYLTQHGLLE